MKRIHPIWVIIMLLLALAAGVCFRAAWKFEAGAPISKGEAIYILETAKASHEYWAAHEDEAWWVTIEGQDAMWVDRYQRIIELIEQQ